LIRGTAADPDRSGNDRARGRPARLERQRRRLKHGVFTNRPETLTNDFFVNLLDMRTAWKATSETSELFEARDAGTNELEWTGTSRPPVRL
jgi:catalase (peroxidase I)